MDICGSEGRDTWRLKDSTNGELHDPYASHNITRVRKSRII